MRADFWTKSPQQKLSDIGPKGSKKVKNCTKLVHFFTRDGRLRSKWTLFTLFGHYFKNTHSRHYVPLKQENNLFTFSPCGCHSLNLCGAKSALCCKDAVTFFVTIQTIYSIFSSSPKKWAILVRNIGVSLHGQFHTCTRWTERIDSVRPFTTHLLGINLSLNELLELNQTAKTKTEIFGAINYVSSYKCVLMSAIWYKVLKAIDERNRVIEARDATIDIEVRKWMIYLMN